MKSRLVAALAVAAAVPLVLTGCNFITPQATTVDYDAADGVSGTTGAVEIDNAVLVTDGTVASLAVTFVNSLDDQTPVSVQVGDESQTLRLDGGLTAYGFPEQQLIFPLDAEAGSLVDVAFQADGSDRVVLPVQVFSTDSAGYEELGPVPTEAPEDEQDPAPSQIDEADPALTQTPEPSDAP